MRALKLDLLLRHGVKGVVDNHTFAATVELVVQILHVKSLATTKVIQSVGCGLW